MPLFAIVATRTIHGNILVHASDADEAAAIALETCEGCGGGMWEEIDAEPPVPTLPIEVVPLEAGGRDQRDMKNCISDNLRHIRVRG